MTGKPNFNYSPTHEACTMQNNENIVVGNTSDKNCKHFLKADFLILRYIGGVEKLPSVSHPDSVALGAGAALIF